MGNLYGLLCTPAVILCVLRTVGQFSSCLTLPFLIFLGVGTGLIAGFSAGKWTLSISDSTDTDVTSRVSSGISWLSGPEQSPLLAGCSTWWFKQSLGSGTGCSAHSGIEAAVASSLGHSTSSTRTHSASSVGISGSESEVITSRTGGFRHLGIGTGTKLVQSLKLDLCTFFAGPPSTGSTVYVVPWTSNTLYTVEDQASWILFRPGGRCRRYTCCPTSTAGQYTFSSCCLALSTAFRSAYSSNMGISETFLVHF